MKSITVIGIGSPYGDDQVGWRVVEHLQRMPEAAGTVALCCDRPGTRLLEDLRGSERAILIDAIHSGTTVGTLHRLDIDRLDDAPIMASSHAFGLAETLRLGKVLGLLPAELSIYGIEIDPRARNHFQAPLTPAVAVTAEYISRLVALELQTFFLAN